MITRILFSTVAVLLVFVGSVSAAVIEIDLSPLPALALNSTNYSLGDHATGISALNADGQPASAASGGEIGVGITFDDITKVLSWDIGYGSDHGFVDLADSFADAHIHAPAAVQFPSPNIGAGVIILLPHTPGSSTLTGSFTGSTVLSLTDETDLLNNLLYINVHSQFALGGEIRGQLVAVVPEPASYLLAIIGLISLVGFGRRRKN